MSEPTITVWPTVYQADKEGSVFTTHPINPITLKSQDKRRGGDFMVSMMLRVSDDDTTIYEVITEEEDAFYVMLYTQLLKSLGEANVPLDELDAWDLAESIVNDLKTLPVETIGGDTNE